MDRLTPEQLTRLRNDYHNNPSGSVAEAFYAAVQDAYQLGLAQNAERVNAFSEKWHKELERTDKLASENLSLVTRLATLTERARAVTSAWAEALGLAQNAEREERAHLQTIDERDAAEEALSQAYYLITGESPEWSNNFGKEAALEQIDDAQRMLRETVKHAESRLTDLTAKARALLQAYDDRVAITGEVEALRACLEEKL